MEKNTNGIKDFLGSAQTPFYGFLACLPFSQSNWMSLPFLPGVFNAANLFLLLTGWALWRRRAEEKNAASVAHPLKVPMLCFVALGGISILSGMSYGAEYLGKAALSFYLNWLMPFFAYTLVLYLAKTREEGKKICVILCAVAGLIGVYTLVEYMRRPDRIEVVFGDPNVLGAFLAYTLFLMLGFFLINFRDRKYWLLLVPFLVMVRALMCTFSRGAYLALAVALHGIVFLRSRLLFVLLLGVSIFLYLNPAFLPDGVRHRLGQTYERRYQAGEVREVLDPSLQGRVEIYKGGMQMIKEHPFMGVGYDLFPAKLVHYWSKAASTDAHNTYLLIGAEMGLPALAVFLWLLIKIFWDTLALYLKTHDRWAKGLALGFLGSIPAFVLSNFYETKIFYHNVSSYFWVLAALVAVMKREA
ncbi:MAG TPA: O-antigen ligase family protein [Candidatus Omnitrophota bacterium]|nr:O-antigen ligase family protein [Candidatus Omnitrophota bacterium]